MSTKSPRDGLRGDRSGNSPEAESRDAPAIPSFDSLRARRRRSPVDLLVPEPEPGPAARVPDAAARAAPRPPDYVDLLRLGVHVLTTLAAVPVRVTVWSVREPVRLLRRLGGPRGERGGRTDPSDASATPRG